MKISGFQLLAAVAAVGLAAALSPSAAAQQSRADGVVIEGAHELNKSRTRKRAKHRARMQCTTYIIVECCRNPQTGKEYCKPIVM